MGQFKSRKQARTDILERDEDRCDWFTIARQTRISEQKKGRLNEEWNKCGKGGLMKIVTKQRRY